MSLDASLVARQVGVSAEYKNTASGQVRYLPQRVYLIAQAQTGVSFSTTKFRATSAKEVGAAAGYKSAAYLMARQLLPLNGDGLGTVPLTVALLGDAGGSAAAVGDITPSGTATKAAQYVVDINNILSDPFVIPKGAISVTGVCRSIHDAINGKLGMPGSATYTYGSPSVEYTRVGTSNGTVTTFTTTGLPKPGAWTLTCTAEATDAGTFTLTDPDGLAVSTSITIGAHVVAGLGFTLTDGAEDWDVGDIATITVPVTKVNFTCGWTGTTGNFLDIRINGPNYGVVFAYTSPTGGLVDPTVDNAISQIGNVWESMIITHLDTSNETTLDTIQAWGEGRWLPTVKKPSLAFRGAHVTTPQSAVIIPSTRTDDRINSQLVNPGSRDLPFVSAARQLARIAVMANNVPSHDYCLLAADGLTPGLDSDQWDLAQRDLAVKGGSSTAEAVGGVVRLSDTVTFWNPEGEVPPAYRYVCDIVKLQNVVYNVDLIFSTPEWAGAALVPDDQAITEATAKKPKMAVAEAAAMIDALALAAIISDPATSKKGILCWIDTQNPKRLNLRIPVKLSGNTNIIDAVIEWAFFFGSAPIAA